MSQLVPGTGYIGPIVRDEPIKCGHAYISSLKGITPVICCKLNECRCAIVKWRMHQGEYVQCKAVKECPKYVPPVQKEVAKSEEV